MRACRSRCCTSGAVTKAGCQCWDQPWPLSHCGLCVLPAQKEAPCNHIFLSLLCSEQGQNDPQRPPLTQFFSKTFFHEFLILYLMNRLQNKYKLLFYLSGKISFSNFLKPFAGKTTCWNEPGNTQGFAISFVGLPSYQITSFTSVLLWLG